MFLVREFACFLAAEMSTAKETQSNLLTCAPFGLGFSGEEEGGLKEAKGAQRA